MNVSPFRLVRGSALAAIAGRANEALRLWEHAWGSLACARVRCISAGETGPSLPVAGEWQCHLLVGGAPVWWSVDPDLSSQLYCRLFGLDPSGIDGGSPVAVGVAAEALSALVTSLIAKVTGQDPAPAPPSLPSAALLRPGSGAVAVTLETDVGSVCWLLSQEALAAYETIPLPPPVTAPVVPLPIALAATPVTLTVELARAELTLGYLRTLAVGDILTLPVKLDQALRVTGPGGGTICEAQLGTQDGARAIELVNAR